jgi:hypothetical protein
MVKDPLLDFNANKPPNLLAQNAATSRFKQRIYRTSLHRRAIFRTGKSSDCVKHKISKDLCLPFRQTQITHAWDSYWLRSEMLARKDAPTPDQDASYESGNKNWISANMCF